MPPALERAEVCVAAQHQAQAEEGETYHPTHVANAQAAAPAQP
jgi:hypothetical protein